MATHEHAWEHLIKCKLTDKNSQFIHAASKNRHHVSQHAPTDTDWQKQAMHCAALL